MALAEAVARGIPVVSTTAGAIPETVPASAGVLVPPGDSRALAKALAPLLDHDDARARLAANARAAASRITDLGGGSREVRGRARRRGSYARPEALTSSGFSAAWLALREPHDAAARAAELVGLLRTRSSDDAQRRRRRARCRATIVDLGAGSGANLRWLAPRLGGEQAWLLVDHDAALLAAAETARSSNGPRRPARRRLRRARLTARAATDGSTTSW